MAKRETRSYADRREYLIGAVRKRRKKIRRTAVEYKGGRCELCGYNRCIDALEFHHQNSSGKDLSISEKGYTRSWDKVKEELDKCVLLCANCHREVHAEVQLSREIGIEKSGEFREAYVAGMPYGNPERSPLKGNEVGGNVQRLGSEEPTQ